MRNQTAILRVDWFNSQFVPHGHTAGSSFILDRQCDVSVRRGGLSNLGQKSVSGNISI